jgi:hypothetical protein
MMMYVATEPLRHGGDSTGGLRSRPAAAAGSGRNANGWMPVKFAFRSESHRKRRFATPSNRSERRRVLCASVPLWLRLVIVIVTCQPVVSAHSGPPFPIVEDRIVGAYRVAIWADPDATDDQSAGGQFWVTLRTVQQGSVIPADTHVGVTIRPLDRSGVERTARAGLVNHDVARQFAALVMDHEGPFAVRVTIDGGLGHADLDASTNATYDLRPAPALMALFVMPFVLAGFVWGKLLIKRKMHARGGR